MASINKELDAYYLSVLEQVLAGQGNPNVFETIRANLQSPDIQAEAQALFGNVPTSIGDLAKDISAYFLQQAPAPSPFSTLMAPESQSFYNLNPQGSLSFEIYDQELIALLQQIPDSILDSKIEL
jgi:hypothetical protein